MGLICPVLVAAWQQSEGHTATARPGVMARRWFPLSPLRVDCGYAADLEVIDDAKESMPLFGRAMRNGLKARALQMLLVP